MQLGVGDEFITKIKALTQGGGQVAQKLLCSAPNQTTPNYSVRTADNYQKIDSILSFAIILKRFKPT